MKRWQVWRTLGWLSRLAFLLAVLGPTADFIADGFVDVCTLDAAPAAAPDFDDDWIVARRPVETQPEAFRPALPPTGPWLSHRSLGPAVRPVSSRLTPRLRVIPRWQAGAPPRAQLCREARSPQTARDLPS